jgi:catechol 2,3-dioxygenase-like lactoylglutathione lyase family enzyme
MINGLRHVCITARDLGRMLGFYRDVIGLKVSKTVTMKGRYLETVFNRKGVELTYIKMRGPDRSVSRGPDFELHHWRRPRRRPKAGLNHISFTVKDIDFEYKRLRASGVKFISKPVRSPDGSTRICFCYDPEGNLIEFVEDL